LFPDKVGIIQRTKRARSMLLIDNSFVVSILFCRLERKGGVSRYWRVEPFVAERDYITLLCTLNIRHDDILDYYVFPEMDMWKSHRLRRNDPLLYSSVKLDRLSDFYAVAKRLWTERCRGSHGTLESKEKRA
jgi:hypothetical protein